MRNEALFFNSQIAVEYGLECSVVLSSLAYWCKHNEDNGKHMYDGKYWTYNSVQAFQKQFPFFGEKTIRNILKKLFEAGLIEKGKFNKTAYDRTTWYSLTDKGWRYFSDKIDSPETVAVVQLPKRANGISQKGKWNSPKGQMEFPERANGISQKGKPIPDNNNNIINNKITDDDDDDGKEATSTSASSFSFSDLPNATVIFTLPTSEGPLVFTDEDVKDLQATFSDLNVLSELKQMALKLKIGQASKTLDEVRRYVTSWLIRAQNNRASSDLLYASPKNLAPEDPNNDITHPKFDREGNELDYNGNIVKTAKQRREEAENKRRKELEASPDYQRLLNILAEQDEEAKAILSPAPAPETNGKHPWDARLEKMNAEKDAKEKAENEAEKYNFLQHPEPRTESVADFKKRMMRTAHKLEENDDTRYF